MHGAHARRSTKKIRHTSGTTVSAIGTGAHIDDVAQSGLPDTAWSHLQAKLLASEAAACVVAAKWIDHDLPTIQWCQW